MKKSQDKYIQSIQELEVLLQGAVESVHATDEMLLEMIENYLNLNAVQIQLDENIPANDIQVSNLQMHLNTLSQIAEKARLTVQDLEVFSKNITDNIQNEVPNSFLELSKTLAASTDKFQDDYEVFLAQLSKLKLKYEANI